MESDDSLKSAGTIVFSCQDETETTEYDVSITVKASSGGQLESTIKLKVSEPEEISGAFSLNGTKENEVDKLFTMSVSASMDSKGYFYLEFSEMINMQIAESAKLLESISLTYQSNNEYLADLPPFDLELDSISGIEVVYRIKFDDPLSLSQGQNLDQIKITLEDTLWIESMNDEGRRSVEPGSVASMVVPR